MPRLVIHGPDEAPRVFELLEGRALTIGRAQTNDIVLLDTSVSRRHAAVNPLAAGGWRITDLGSSNGIQIKGAVVREIDLKNEDEVLVGGYTLRYEEPEERVIVTPVGAGLPEGVSQVLKLTASSVGALGIPTPAAAPLVPQFVPPPASSGVRPAAGVAAPVARESAQERIRALERENQLLKLVYRVGRALGDLATVDDVVERVLEMVLEIEGVERGYAMLLDDKGGFHPAIIRYRHHRDSASAHQMILSQSIIRRVMDGGAPVLVQDARADARFSASESMVLSGMQSAMCAPLKSGQGSFGIFYVDNLSKRGMFAPEDLDVFAVISAQAGLAIDHVLAKKEVAQQIIRLNALERFLSPPIARKITAEAADLRLGGENQKVTVLFADIRGFTPMAEAMRPEEVVGVLNEYFGYMADLLFKHEGTLDKFLGDGLMCLFGAPFSRDDDAVRAVRTSIDMQVQLAELNRDLKRPPLHIGIGINTGPVVAGYIGAPRRLDYTAIGDNVNIASRLTSLAQPDQILASASTFAEIEGKFAAKRLEPVKVKGRTERIEIYEILWQEFLPGG